MKFITLGQQLSADGDFRSWLQDRGNVVALTLDTFNTVDDVPTCDCSAESQNARIWLAQQLEQYEAWRDTPPWEPDYSCSIYTTEAHS